MDLNKIERGIEKLNYRDCNLVELVDDEIVARKYEAGLRKIKIKQRLPKSPVVVKIDVDRFRLALNPLMDNAVKFSPDNGTVTIEVQLRGRFVQVKIQDEGPGVKAREIDNLMNLNFLKPSESTQRLRGSGLGLSIAKRLIELHNGRIWIESDGKSGTSVYFRIPVKES